jgi:hypothetical protein
MIRAEVVRFERDEYRVVDHWKNIKRQCKEEKKIKPCSTLEREREREKYITRIVTEKQIPWIIQKLWSGLLRMCRWT